MTTATILGLDTAAGAYLARLLVSRGYTVLGTGKIHLLERLGIAGDVTICAALSSDEVYDLRGDAKATRDLIATAAPPRLLVTIDPGDTDGVDTLAAARATGRFVATARLFPHESRLGPGMSPVARIVAAAAAGAKLDAVDLATSTDCGWTAEYVDALWRLLQRTTPLDVAIATGVSISGEDAGRVASAYFGRPAPGLVGSSNVLPGDPAVAYAALGWRAVTIGDDLVKVLCEGTAAL